MNAKNNKNNGMNVIENKENEMQVTEESRKAYGRPSVNEEKAGSWITLSLSTFITTLISRAARASTSW